MRSLLISIVVAALACGCSRARSEEPRSRSIDVELGGCLRVVAPETCVLAESRVLHLWTAAAPSGALRVTADDRPIANVAPRLVQNGTMLEVSVPPASTRLEVRTTLENGVIGRLAFRLAEDDAPAWLREATRLRTDGKLDEAEAILGAHDGANDRERAWALGIRARIALRRNEIDRAASLFRAAIAGDRAASSYSNEGDDAAALSYLLSARMRDTKGALDVLAASAPAFAKYSEGKTDESYARGIVLYEAGDARAALRVLGETIASGEKLALHETVRSARATMALQLEYLGRWEEALETLQTIAASDGPSTPPCARASVLVDVGEGRMLAAESGAGGAFGDPLPPLEEALAIHRAACSDDYERAMALSNAGQASIRRGDAPRARAYLEDAKRAVPSPEPYLQACFAEVDARIALTEKRYEAARDAFTREAQIGEASFFAVERWRGALGLGEALEAMGQLERAAQAYEEAETALDQGVTRVPLGEGRETFVADRETSARNLVDLLVRMKRPAEALRRARIARARVTASLASSAQIDALPPDARKRWLTSVDAYRRERDALAREAAIDWQHPKERLDRERAAHRAREAAARAALDEALSEILRAPANGPAYAPPPDGVLLVAYFPIRKGWVALGATGGAVRAVRFDLPPAGAPASDVSAALLEPFAGEIAKAREILVMSQGAVRAIDLHALPFRGAPLNHAIALRHVLDLGEPSPAAGHTALVLSDPTGDLEEARIEGGDVRAALERLGTWPVRSLTGDAVTSAALARELADASIVHFAGHAIYGGREGWESAFPLAHGARFTVGDVLALPHAPERVVLSACDAAKSSTQSAEGLGLAQSFLVAGARTVIAPTRPVADATAHAMAIAIYASLARGGTLVTALREAGETVRASDTDADWSAFRALTR